MNDKQNQFLWYFPPQMVKSRICATHLETEKPSKTTPCILRNECLGKKIFYRNQGSIKTMFDELWLWDFHLEQNNTKPKHGWDTQRPQELSRRRRRRRGMHCSYVLRQEPRCRIFTSCLRVSYLRITWLSSWASAFDCLLCLEMKTKVICTKDLHLELTPRPWLENSLSGWVKLLPCSGQMVKMLWFSPFQRNRVNIFADSCLIIST